MKKVLSQISLYLRMIKFSHSVFALPFAFTSALLAASGVPSLHLIFWIIVAMVSARSGAMGLNRIIDSKIDKENPRTSGREIPSGKLTIKEATLFAGVSLVILVIAAYHLNVLCLRLAPLAIFILTLYSYSKRFTWMSHFVLGIAISLAPLGAWIAVKGTIDMAIFPLTGTVVFWLAGFDVLYALQDIEFDRTRGLYSIPRRFGIGKALLLSRLFHAAAMILLVYTGILFDRGAFYWIGITIVAGLFIYEHSLVKPDDLSRLDVAFFTMNGYISVTVFIATLMDYLMSLS